MRGKSRFFITAAKAAPQTFQLPQPKKALMCPRPSTGKGKIIGISTRFNPARFWLTDVTRDIVRFCIGNGGLLVWKPHFNLTRRIG